ncbi:hypothetical protein TAGGR_375 [Thermodesulfovibrio aggregans]|uniref:DUF996 domain-containing protein n=1 Tax=Thermodesulfovibrio aggregans TaxID=86166 RepID=A0A0U9HTL9_9BACT|nr:DUF996 domain-containing protein [Thermodesulfovibrio aggregans]GAQ95602.1 hypothetical protein TAGGR_375 [Thermodesulfovibrio aggregans]
MEQTGNVKILGGLGSIFVILGFIPWIGWLLSIAGIVLLFIAMNKLSQIFSDKNIFNKFLTGFLISLAGILLGVIFGLFSMLPMMKNGSYHSMPSGFGLVFTFLIVYALNIAGMYFYRQCFNIIHNYTGINLFKLAGTFMFWGAIGVIVFGLGAIGIFVGWILLAVAFFGLPETYEKTV